MEGGRPKVTIPARGIIIAGLVLLAASVPLPFAANDAGITVDRLHTYSAHRWYIWHPFHDFGLLPLLIGIGLTVIAWRADDRRPRAFWAGQALGWLGIVLLTNWSADVLKAFLYGEAEVRLLPTRWVVVAGWALLSFGVFAHVYRPSEDPGGTGEVTTKTTA